MLPANLTICRSFFWRLSHAEAVTRGWDISVTEPTAAEDRKARLKLHNLKQGERLYKFAVYDDKNSRAKPVYVVGGQPFSKSHASLIGRASRCFIAYHLMEDRVVLLKDPWRILAPGLIAEGRVYEQLHKAKVPHIAELILGGDIPGQNQKTYTKGNSQREHQHYRLVLGTIGSDLTSFRSSWEMVTAVKCAMIGMSSRREYYHSSS